MVGAGYKRVTTDNLLNTSILSATPIDFLGGKA